MSEKCNIIALQLSVRGASFFWRETVCALLICGLCNVDYNEENIIRCPEHSERDKKNEDKENKALKLKENQPLSHQQRLSCPSKLTIQQKIFWCWHRPM
jgi:hypothetical protein